MSPIFPGETLESKMWTDLRDGGTAPYYLTGGGSFIAGTPGEVTFSWTMAGMQSLLTAVRTAGANNIVMIGGIQAAGQMDQWLTYKPTDPINQLAASWHGYAQSTIVGSAGALIPHFGTGQYTYVASIAAQYPVVIGETGDHSADGTVGSAYLSTLLPWADSQGISYLGWYWSYWPTAHADNVLIKDINGTPTDGYGVYFKQHLQCLASGGSNCSAVNGICGPASGAVASSAPTASLCAIGAASSVTGTGPWNWTCAGTSGGVTANCSAATIINGACGASNGAMLPVAPTASLCSAGTASAVAGSGPWSWSCAGANSGTTASCSATLKVNGLCGASNNASFSSAPTTNLCSAGSASSVSGSGPWSWNCAGINSGATASCSALVQQPAVNGQCGGANGVSVTSAPSASLCGAGAATSVTGSGPWNWSCTGVYGGTNASCAAPLKVNGQCGSANAVPISSTPTNLCTAGTASSVSGGIGSSWSWNCAGANTGSTASCTAPFLVNFGTNMANLSPAL